MGSHCGSLSSHFPPSSALSLQDNLDALEIDSDEGDSGEPVNKSARIPVQRSKCMKSKEKLTTRLVSLCQFDNYIMIIATATYHNNIITSNFPQRQSVTES